MNITSLSAGRTKPPKQHSQPREIVFIRVKFAHVQLKLARHRLHSVCTSEAKVAAQDNGQFLVWIRHCRSLLTAQPTAE